MEVFQVIQEVIHMVKEVVQKMMKAGVKFDLEWPNDNFQVIGQKLKKKKKKKIGFSPSLNFSFFTCGKKTDLAILPRINCRLILQPGWFRR